MIFFSDNEILSGVHQGMRVETGIKVSTLFGLIVIFAKNASFRSYGVICLPPTPTTTLKPQTTDTKGII